MRLIPSYLSTQRLYICFSYNVTKLYSYNIVSSVSKIGTAYVSTLPVVIDI